MSAKATFTKGPWVVHRTSEDGLVSVTAGRETIGGFIGGDDTSQELANAALIAASPELYEALSLLVTDLADYPASDRPVHAVNVAMAALAKARGEP